MNELKLTIQEAQEMLLMSQSSVYAWIDKGKLQTTESPAGKLVVISRKEALQIRELNLKSKRNKTSKLIASTFDSTEDIPVINAEIPVNDNFEPVKNSPQNTPQASDTVILQLVSKLEELAHDAGRFKQLEIIRNEEKEDVKYWKDKYFEINTLLVEKNFEIEALKKQISALEKKKGLFSFLKP